MRRRRSINVRDYSKDAALEKVKRKMLNRWHVLAPCTVAPLDLYKALYTKEEARAMITLRHRYKSMLRTDSDFEVVWDMAQFTVRNPFKGVLHSPTKVNIDLPDSLPVPVTESWKAENDVVLLSTFPNALLEAMDEWGRRWVRCSIEYTEVVEKVTTCFSTCNTMGQVKRVWPNLCSFLPEPGQEILRNAKVRSKLPDALVMYAGDGDRQLHEDWLPEVLTPYDMLITEALVLPERESMGNFPMRIQFEKR